MTTSTLTFLSICLVLVAVLFVGYVLAKIVRATAALRASILEIKQGFTRSRSFRRVILPLSSGELIMPNTSAMITARPQDNAIHPERVIIGGTPSDWLVNDIKVGGSGHERMTKDGAVLSNGTLGRSQFCQSGDVPGELFAANTVDSFISFETIQKGQPFTMIVTNISDKPRPFYASALGIELDEEDVKAEHLDQEIARQAIVAENVKRMDQLKNNQVTR